uniref:LolToxI n=1 Tax=Bichromomyia olmeca TaxID=715919 RepID=A0A1B1V3H1_9DIPT|nr:LolToxI [Bichromomyia olmeca]
MNSKFIVLCFIIIAIVAISASPSSLPEDHSISKRDTCRYLFGNCTVDKCCKYLYCSTYKTCLWHWHSG